MRYALPSVLLLSCSGTVFTGAPVTDAGATGGTGGTESSGGAATGGTTTSGGTGGTGGSARDASVDGPESALPDGSIDSPAEALAAYTSCPPSAPSETSSSCSGIFDCAYGNDARVSCRTVFQCRNGQWLVSAKQCPPAKYCPDFPVPPVNGALCATKDDFCTYAVGDDCACVQGATLTWKCAPKPAPPCARRPENKGQPCENDDAGTCTYGACGSPERVQTQCEAGVWTWSAPLCGGLAPAAR